jgi:hypothetical protein
MSNKRANKILGVVVAGISMVALVLVLAVKETTPQFAGDSPEASVQQYLQAVTDRDFDTALTYLATDSKCKIEDFDRAYIQESVRIGLAETTETQTRATVKVTVESSNGDPFGGNFTENQAFRLVSSEAGWKITGIPWPTYECGGVYK